MKERILQGKPANQRLRNGFRLHCARNVWKRKMNSGTWDDWFQPILFEDLCNADAALEALAKEASEKENAEEPVRQKLLEIFKKQYLPIILQKYMLLQPALAEYFAAKADAEQFEPSRKLLKALKERAGIQEGAPLEDLSVISLKDLP